MNLVVINRPKPLMGLKHVYHLSNLELAESYSGDESLVDLELLAKHPGSKEIRTLHYGGWLYKGIVMKGEK